MSPEDPQSTTTSTAPPNTTSITLRAPTTSTSTSTINMTTSFTPPTVDWLSGTWHVTHSTLPIWKKARNVCITYTPLPLPATTLDTSSTTGTPSLSDLVTYFSLSSTDDSSPKTVRGVDKAAGPGCWNWRGSGWLMIASSHWEVLGFGDLEREEEGNQWVVTFFEKTLFTPRGLDVYSRRKEGVGEAVLARIKEALGMVEDEGVRRLGEQLFVVKSN